MGRPAFHPPPEAKGEGKGARSRAREGSEGGRGIEVGSVGSQPCAPTASLLSCSLLSSRISLALSSSILLPLDPSSSSCNVSFVHSFSETPESDMFHVQSFYPTSSFFISYAKSIDLMIHMYNLVIVKFTIIPSYYFHVFSMFLDFHLSKTNKKCLIN